MHGKHRSSIKLTESISTLQPAAYTSAATKKKNKNKKAIVVNVALLFFNGCQLDPAICLCNPDPSKISYKCFALFLFISMHAD